MLNTLAAREPHGLRVATESNMCGSLQAILRAPLSSCPVGITSPATNARTCPQHSGKAPRLPATGPPEITWQPEFERAREVFPDLLT